MFFFLVLQNLEVCVFWIVVRNVVVVVKRVALDDVGIVVVRVDFFAFDSVAVVFVVRVTRFVETVATQTLEVAATTLSRVVWGSRNEDDAFVARLCQLKKSLKPKIENGKI